MDFIVEAATDIGLVRKTNQDNYSVKVVNFAHENVAFAVLCDGMGGLASGEIASSAIVSGFEAWFDGRFPFLVEKGINDELIRSEWTAIVTMGNDKIKDYASKIGKQMGTTLTAILITDNRYYVINVGDSRIYEIGSTVRQITKDHSLVAREVEAGRLTEEEARTDSRQNILTQCVGAVDFVKPDFFFGRPLANGCYLLCSDGFRHKIDEEDILLQLSPFSISNNDDIQRGISYLIDLNKQRQETDNITAVVIKAQDEGRTEELPSVNGYL